MLAAENPYQHRQTCNVKAYTKWNTADWAKMGRLRPFATKMMRFTDMVRYDIRLIRCFESSGSSHRGFASEYELNVNCCGIPSADQAQALSPTRLLPQRFGKPRGAFLQEHAIGNAAENHGKAQGTRRMLRRMPLPTKQPKALAPWAAIALWRRRPDSNRG